MFVFYFYTTWAINFTDMIKKKKKRKHYPLEHTCTTTVINDTVIL